MEETTTVVMFKTLDSNTNILFGFYKGNQLFIFDTSSQNGYREANETEIEHHQVVTGLARSNTEIFDILIWLKTNIVFHDLKVDLIKLRDSDRLNIDSTLKEIMHDCLIRDRINKSVLSNIHEESTFYLKLVKDDIRWCFPSTWTKEWIIEKLTTNNSKRD